MNAYKDPKVIKLLSQRVDRTLLKQRFQKETTKEKKVRSRAKRFFFHENRFSFRSIFRKSLKLTGLLARGQRNALNLQVTRNEVWLAKLPIAFDGYRILHLSDLHLDANAGLASALKAKLAALDYDICLITGDFRARSFGPIDACLHQFQQIKPLIKSDVYATLGNHDSILMVPGLEAMGIKLLLNESVRFERAGQGLSLIGIDDPHYFQSDDLIKASQGATPGERILLMAHSPEVIPLASKLGVDFYLCGHTHGGQICLPGGFPIVSNSRSPRRFSAGAWQYREMKGYTSRGSGVSIVDVRFNCLPEITVHTLRAS
jgi:predicted MPP superfamily phosphohydrolase